jgi:formate hydrogenlyase transcriptional activator
MPDLSRPAKEQALLRYEALAGVSTVIASQHSVADLLEVLCDQLHAVVPFDYLALVLYDPQKDVMRLAVLEPADAPRPPFTEMPVDSGGPAGQVLLSQKPAVIHHTSDEPRGPALDFIRQHGWKVTCWLPLTTAHRRVGVLTFGSSKADTYGDEVVVFMEQVAAHVAVAVDNAINYDNAQAYQRELSEDRDRLRLLLDVNNLLVSQLDYRALLPAISNALRHVIRFDYASLALYDSDTNQLRLRAVTYHDERGVLEPNIPLSLEGSPGGVAFHAGAACVFRRADLEKFPTEGTPTLLAAGLQSICCLPLVTRRARLGVLSVASTSPDAFSTDEVTLLDKVSAQIAIAVENALAYREVTGRNDLLVEEKLYLEDEIRLQQKFGDIIGQSDAHKRVLKEIETVAPTDATVLLLGETGTGKELLARAIHTLSPRRNHTFVRMSAAALPTGLLESELFGYEKGAFTGASSSRIGRLELAHRGTLFLDEVGDIPLELQPKLLRVLQEREFERLGSTRTERVDVRLIAATNRDLESDVEKGTFRSDLFYRLNVFPVHIPPLRDRAADIPLLVRYFVKKYANRMGRRLRTIPTEALRALQGWSWPGNIRELENVIERAVILSPGPVLQVPIGDLKTRRHSQAGGTRPTASTGMATMQEAERSAILQALKESNGRVAGESGAASRLGLKRTTLQSKMRKLGIKRPSY